MSSNNKESQIVSSESFGADHTRFNLIILMFYSKGIYVFAGIIDFNTKNSDGISMHSQMSNLNNKDSQTFSAF